MAHRILRVTEAQPLTAANYLADYEAVILELTWQKLVGLKDGPQPGYSQAADRRIIADLEHRLSRRTTELLALLLSGGIAGVKAHAGSSLSWRDALGKLAEYINTYAWLVGAVALLGSKWQDPFRVGSGTAISIQEQGHPLEEVLRNATQYSALIRDDIFDNNGPIILATSRIGDPVAAEIPVGPGLVFLLPNGVDDVALLNAFDALLDERARNRSEWVLPREAELMTRERKLREVAQGETRKLEAERAALADLRATVMKEIHVERAIKYYENGVSASRDVKHAMQDLYKLVEMLEAQLGGSEDALATALSVPKSLFKHIKKLANQKELDFRHTTSGAPIGADADDIQQARDDAKQLVHKFIEVRCDEEAKRRIERVT